jgi:hypothetical protein
MKREIWIGVIEISYSVDTVERLKKLTPLPPNGRESAFTVVTTWASSYEEYSQQCRKMVESENQRKSIGNYLRDISYISSDVVTKRLTIT